MEFWGLGLVSESLLKIKATLNLRISLNSSFLSESSVSERLLPLKDSLKSPLNSRKQRTYLKFKEMIISAVMKAVKGIFYIQTHVKSYEILPIVTHSSKKTTKVVRSIV